MSVAAPMPPAGPPHKKPWWVFIPHFLGHVAASTVIFAIIAAPALLLSWGVHYLEHLEWLGPFEVFVLKFIEGAILVVDAVTFLGYLIYSIFVTFKERFQ